MEIQQTNRGKASYNAFVAFHPDIVCKAGCGCTKALVWYSYRYKQYYCKGCHRTSDGTDYLMSFQTQEEFLSHMKNHHDTKIELFVLPPITDDIVMSIAEANEETEKLAKYNKY
jgi:hypothetical protein